MRLAVTIILGLAAISVAYADHNSLHECNYLMPGYTPDRFQDLGDGTVYDNRTGLVWQRCAYGENWYSGDNSCVASPVLIDWDAALRYIKDYNTEQQNLGKPVGWRMPNIKELASLINRSCIYPAAYHETFPAMGAPSGNGASVVWSSTPYLLGTVKVTETDSSGSSGWKDETAVWCIDFKTGKDQNEKCPIRGTEGRHLYLVRTPAEGAPP